MMLALVLLGFWLCGVSWLETAAGDDRTESFWVTVFIHKEPHFRAENAGKF